MHRRAFYAYAYVYVIAIKEKTVLFSFTAIQEPVTLKCEIFHPEHPEQKRKNGDRNANKLYFLTCILYMSTR